MATIPDKAAAVQYYKARQQSILLKLEDLEGALANGADLASYEAEDESLRADQPNNSRFAQAFEAEQRRTRGAPEAMSFRGTDNAIGDAAAAAAAAAAGASASAATAMVSSTAVKSGQRTEHQLKQDKALLNACYFGNTNAALKMVRNGADPEFMDDRDGWASIHYAARWGDLKIVMALLNAGADVNLRTFDKETALHKACRWDQRDVAILLLHRGALAHYKNGDGNKASDMTTNTELSYLCNNYEEWTVAEIARIKQEAEDKKFQAFKEEQMRRQEEKVALAEAAKRAQISRGGLGKK